MKNTLSAERFERMNALIIRRLQAAGSEGIRAKEFSQMLRMEFGSEETVNRHRLVAAVNNGKIFRKIVNNYGGGRTGIYFLTEQLRDAYVDNNSPDAVYIAKENAIPIPKFGVESEREPEGIILAKGVTMKPGVKVQVLTPYLGDYRIKVDLAAVPRHVDSSQCREWAKA